MSKTNISKVEQSGGTLSFNRHFELEVNEFGDIACNIDFTNYTFEDNSTQISHITIINDGGINPVWFVFDAVGSTISITDNSTYNGKCYAGKPYSEITYSGNASSIGFRCATGKTTTVKVIVW